MLSGAGGVKARIVDWELTRLGVIYSVDTVLARPSSSQTTQTLQPANQSETEATTATHHQREKVVESAATLGSGGGSSSAYLVMFVILALYGLKTIPLIK